MWSPKNPQKAHNTLDLILFMMVVLLLFAVLVVKLMEVQ